MCAAAVGLGRDRSAKGAGSITFCVQQTAKRRVLIQILKKVEEKKNRVEYFGPKVCSHVEEYVIAVEPKEKYLEQV